MMKRIGRMSLRTLMVLMAASAIATAATVEVNGVNNPPTSFATVKDAVDYLNANNADEVNNTVNVTTDGPILETGVIVIDSDQEGGFTLDGDADGNATPCTLITDASAVGSGANFLAPDGVYNCQIYIGGAASTYTIQDLILQPIFRSPGSTLDGAVDGIVIEDVNPTGPNLGKIVNLLNVTIGGSNAGDVLAADPDINEWSTSTHFGEGLMAEDSDFTGSVDGEIHLTRLRTFNTHDYGAALHSDYTEIDINEGCIFAWAGESAIRPGYDSHNSILTIDGTPGERILVRGSGQDDPDEEGLDCVGPGDETHPFEWQTMTYTDLIENGAENEFGRHLGPTLMDNCFVSLNGFGNDDADGSDTGLRYGYGTLPAVIGSSTTRTIQNCTIYDTLNPASLPPPNPSQRSITFNSVLLDGITFNLSNVIIAGSTDYAFYLPPGSDSIVNINDCALVTAGPDALSASYAGSFDGPGTGNFTINESNVTASDPQFSSITYTYGDTSEFLRVTNPAYITAGPGGGQLTGAGAPIGPTPTPTETPIVAGVRSGSWRNYR